MGDTTRFVPSAIRAAGLAVVVVCVLGTLLAQSGSMVDDLLTEVIGFSEADLRVARTGEAVVRSLDTPVREELAHAGAIHIDQPVERYLERFRDIERFERGPGVPQIGRYGSLPRLEDMEALRLPAGDVAALRECRPGACEVKLSATAMERFRHDVDWSSPDAIRQASDIFRQMLVDLVIEYQAGGNEALGQYDDTDEPEPVAEQFRALLAGGNQLPELAGPLLTYLDRYPRHRPDGTEDFFYWSVVGFGLKPTVRVNHVMIYPLMAARSTEVAYAIAIKQLYASHYFHTALELRLLADDRRQGGRRGSMLVSITRSRNDGMTGFAGLFRRPVINGRSRNAVRGYLEHMKRQVESPASGAAPPD